MRNQTWPPHLEALIAAPENHKLLFENERVRVLDTTIQPGHTTPLHTHCWPAALYVLGVSEFIRRDENGSVTLDSRDSPPLQPGSSLWIPPLPPHTLENIGTTEIRIIAVEIKNQDEGACHGSDGAGNRAYFFGATSASSGNPAAITYIAPSVQFIHFFAGRFTQ